MISLTPLLAPRRPTLASFSACRLCRHSLEAGIELQCRHPQLADALTGPQPVALLRAPGSACGPHAAHMEASYFDRTARPL